MEQGVNKADSRKDTENLPKGSSKAESSGKNLQQSLKAKSKFVKRSQPSRPNIKKNKGFKRIPGKDQQRKNRAIVGEREISHNGNGRSKKQTSQDSQQNRTADEQHEEKSQQVDNSNEDSRNRGTSDKPFTGQSHHIQNSNEKTNESNVSKQEQKNRGKHVKPNKGANNRMNENEKGSPEKVNLNEGKREKLGGLIFMCSAKTKPDCFHYQVMGVSSGKKDVVLGVKRGLKLFLYDFDLKLLYGIYKATSSGGMKLEPKAFNGSFPAQVRFSIEKDCFPLPESIFKKAIKENYDERNKFKTELTVRQVRKLTGLFRPATIHSTLLPLRTCPKVLMLDREVSDGVEGQWSHLHRERSDQDPYANSHGKNYNVLQHERKVRDLFLTEKDYRAYGLQGDGRNLTPPSHANPILEPHERETEHLHQLGSIYREDVPSQSHVERLLTDPLYLNKREYQAYGHGVDDYRYGSSRRDPYSQPSYRDDEFSLSSLVGGRILSRAGNLPRRETFQDSLYSTYAAEALPEYSQARHYHRAQPVSMHAPVSSRYAFDGPSHSYR
ncbi:uncharacterized protein LOC114754081 [Neltuma alba]|uniref:uncharacterized protein LOC114754081 n=1 Tax=Neltuma alba TaxID=207710 RepID=UPI0010A53003|nr:uncharacterized protein LOC114754081 [Prosopis alba]